MEQEISKLFKNIKSEPEEVLSGNIWRVICAREHTSYKIKSWCYALVGTISLVWLILALRELMTEFAKSGFYEYMSLLFSDGGLVVSNLREFALSLADSLPVTSLIFSLLAVFILFISIKRIVRQLSLRLNTA